MTEIILNFISMGGHGFYIWVSYIIPLTLIFIFILFQKEKLRKIIKKTKENEKKNIRD